MPMPPTNLVCADVDGNIAFRIAVFAPARQGWTGRLPVPGTGKYEWGPESGPICPPNTTPSAATLRRPITTRIRAVRSAVRLCARRPALSPPRADRRDDHQRQVVHDRRHDPHAARFAQLGSCGTTSRISAAGRSDDPAVEQARALVAGWDAVMNRESTRRRHLHVVAAAGRHGGSCQGITRCRRDGATARDRGPDQVAGCRLGRVAMGPDEP